MKYLIPIATLLSFLLLIGIIYTVTTEVSELRDEVGLLRKQVTGLQDYIDVTDNKCDRIKAEVADMVKPFTRLIPINGGWLAVREENP